MGLGHGQGLLVTFVEELEQGGGAQPIEEAMCAVGIVAAPNNGSAEVYWESDTKLSISTARWHS